MKPANNAAIYACMYSQLAEIARSHGYALAVHGSFARDMDLIAVPWIESPDAPHAVISAIEADFAIKRIGELTPAAHGRMIQTIGVKFGECFIDLSFMPVAPAAPAVVVDEAMVLRFRAAYEKGPIQQSENGRVHYALAAALKVDAS